MKNYLSKQSAIAALCFITFGLVAGLLSFLCYNSYNKFYSSRYTNSNVNIDYHLKQLDCLTKNIYYEAATEPFEGKVAVAQVTLNRVNDARFPKSVCEVVYQKNIIYEKVICQFSWYCNRPSSLKVVDKKLYRESERVAKLVLFENFRLSSVENSIYYHADYVNPGWKKVKVAKIGRHIFYE